MTKVLVINDSRFERKIFADLLTDLGVEVKTAEEFSITDQLQQFQPEIIIVNLIMENTTGDRLIAAIKEKYPDIKCVLSSSNSLSLADYKDYQVDAVLQTPLKKEKLVSLLDKLKPTTTSQQDNQQITNYSYCPHCGDELTDKQFTFCPHCGGEL